MKKTLFITLLVGAFSYGQVFANGGGGNSTSASPPVGTLIVKGDPGEGQSNEYKIYGCEGTVELPQKYSCKYLRDEKLNQGTFLTEGVYRINYANSEKYIQIKVGQEISEVLDRIEITPKGYSYRVFLDLTDENMQRALLAIVWSWSGNLPKNGVCIYEYESMSYKDVCRIKLSSDFEEYSGLLKFNDDGSWESLEVRHLRTYWYAQGRKFIAHTFDSRLEKTFVSVFRGAYMIEFKRGNDVAIEKVKSCGDFCADNSESMEQN